MASDAGQILPPAEGFGLQSRLFSLWAKKAVLPYLGHFWCSVVTLVILRSQLKKKIYIFLKKNVFP